MPSRRDRLHRLARLPRRLLASVGGVVSIEFALLTPVLLVILLHLVDFGMAFHQRMKLESAARAGLQYAMYAKDDTAGIRDAVERATNLDPADIIINITEFCECGGTAATCGTTCTDGTWAGTYIRVTTDATFTALFTLYGLQDVFDMQGSAEARVQ